MSLIVYPAKFTEDEGALVVTFRDISAVTQGYDFNEAYEMAADALKCACEMLFEQGKPLPDPSPREDEEIWISISVFDLFK